MSAVMFEALSDKLGAVFDKLGRRGRIGEKEIDEALREVRMALLEADVNFKVVREFVDKVKARAVEPGALEGVTPAQAVIDIVREELAGILGGAQKNLTAASAPPTIVMMAGLQGAGKTTTAAKLAVFLRKQGNRPLLVAADVKRPAAVEQLVALGKQTDVPVYDEGAATNAVAVCERSLKRAREVGANWVILDTAGRLQIDEEMMDELAEIKRKLKPSELLLVVDAMTGQEAVNVAQGFHERLALTGLVLTKLDGDARGGAALSINSVTGLPIKFIATGEKTDAFEPYHPDRLASRILGMGDMATLIEKAQETVDVEKAKAFEQKVRRADFDLEDFLDQLQQMKKLGSIGQILEMVPGGKMLGAKLPKGAMDDAGLVRVEAMIQSMTPKERAKPEIIGGSRRKRIANGSGTTPSDVNRLLSQFQQVRKMMKRMSSGKMKGLPRELGMLR